ncbi:MAG: efflux RND transporter permease subunit [Gemmataceae bacterium]|nr:efflux RND transporter permease subunit [Gemmataceae bacterium]
MSISEICIRRPVFTWVLVAIPVVMGLVSYFDLGVDLFPKVDFPVVSVTANLPGTGAEEMESSVTKIIEEAVNTISGVDEVQSRTREGFTSVVVQFTLEKNGDVGAQEVRDKVSSITKQLPQGMEPPVINKFDLGSAPIMTIGVSGSRPVRDVTEIARLQILERLQTVPGVGAVFMSGNRSRAVNVIVDTDKLSSYGLSVEDVRLALANQNLEVPGGILDQGQRELVLRTLGRVQKASQFGDLILAQRKGYPIRVRDVARVEDTIEEPRGLTRLDGQNSVSLFVQKQSGTNTVAISDTVQERLAEIAPTLPPDIKIELTQDQSRFIRDSMRELKFHLLLAGVLVAGTILLFIRDWRTTVIATMAIPTSIIPTFLFMSYMGFTLNNITMLGLILAIGIVIDDAVVVHENIFRHMEEYGKDAVTASREGTSEIALAVLATSLSLVVIFVPVAFMGGMVGRFFSSFGLTVAFAVMMSLFVSFTLTPMLCAKFLKLEPAGEGHGTSKDGIVWRLTEGAFGRALRWALKYRLVTLILSFLVVLSTGPIAAKMGFNFVPRDDTSEFQVSFITPEGYTLDRTNQVVTEIEARLAALPGVRHRFTTIGENSGNAGKGQGDVTRGSIYFRISELDERQYSQFDLMQRARVILLDYPELRTTVSDVSAIGGGPEGDTRTFQVSVSGPDLGKLAEFSEAFKTRLRQVQGLVDVDTNMSLRKPEVQVSIDRDRASDLGVPVQTIANTLNVLVGGQIVSRYKEAGEQYDVWLRADKAFRSNPQGLSSLTVPSPEAGPVQLGALTQPLETRGPSQINRLNRQRTVTILAHPDQISLNDAMIQAKAIAKDLDLPPGYAISFGGQAKMLGETGYYFAVALGLSVLFMYLILAAQFESWLHPVSILSALPVTIPFGLLSLLMFGQPMDLYAMFGLFMLIGIVKKNGILQVDKTNELRRAGMPRDAAIMEANHTRLRPILMTTFMLVAAMIPLALGAGPGAGARASLAKVIIGGQMFSLVLSLLVTPVVYSVIDSLQNLALRLVFRGKKTPPLPETSPSTTPARVGLSS